MFSQAHQEPLIMASVAFHRRSESEASSEPVPPNEQVANLLHHQDAAAQNQGWNTPCPVAQFTPNLAHHQLSYSPVFVDDIGFAPLFPTDFADAPPVNNINRRTYKVQPRFAALNSEIFPIHEFKVPSFDPVSSDEESEAEDTFAEDLHSTSEMDRLATLSSAEKIRQERLDSLKLSPKKKSASIKQPVPQRPPIRMQPRRNSFSAIAA